MKLFPAPRCRRATEICVKMSQCTAVGAPTSGNLPPPTLCRLTHPTQINKRNYEIQPGLWNSSIFYDFLHFVEILAATLPDTMSSPCSPPCRKPCQHPCASPPSAPQDRWETVKSWMCRMWFIHIHNSWFKQVLIDPIVVHYCTIARHSDP